MDHDEEDAAEAAAPMVGRCCTLIRVHPTCFQPLKLSYDEPLSDLALIFNVLRPYNS